MLDGRTLWLAIDERPGSLALRDSDSGDVIALAGDLTDDQPGYRSIRVDLGGLPGTDDVVYDVVLVPSGGRPARPVWSAPLERRPIPAGDGSTQWSMRRTDEGMLQLHRGSPSPAAELRAIEVGHAGLRLTVSGPGRTLALLGDDDQPAAQVPLSDDDSAVISPDALPELGGPLRVVLGEPGAWLPVRRRANDLAQPGRGAPLPELETGDSSCQLRWSPQAHLLLQPMAAGGGR